MTALYPLKLPASLRPKIWGAHDLSPVFPAQPERIHLDHLAADLDAAGKRDLHLTAVSGVYDRDHENLDLGGGIELITSDGYHFETESAWLDLGGGRVVGKQPIAGRGPTGTLSADRFRILEAGDILQFEGRVKVTVFPRSEEPQS